MLTHSYRYRSSYSTKPISAHNSGRLPKEAVDAPSLEAFKAWLDVALGSLGCWLVNLHAAGGWNEMSIVVLVNTGRVHRNAACSCSCLPMRRFHPRGHPGWLACRSPATSSVPVLPLICVYKLLMGSHPSPVRVLCFFQCLMFTRF